MNKRNLLIILIMLVSMSVNTFQANVVPATNACKHCRNCTHIAWCGDSHIFG